MVAPSAISVRRLARAEVDRVVPLFGAYRRFYRRRPNADLERRYLAARIRRGEAVVFVANDGSTPVGFTLLYPLHSSLSLRPIWVLNDLYVRPDHRRSGVGRALLRRARAFAHDSGAEYLTLETAVDNPAQRLYEAEGWVRDVAFLHYERRA